jgi:tetratricopeptide (TPR) repeat protein
MIGKTVSHYRVIRKLGEGGMGVVYEAEDLNLRRNVALKFCSAAQDPKLRAALLNEAQALCSLIHPNIAEVYELGQTDEGEPFIVMELLPGALDGELRGGRLGVRRSVRIVTAVAKALEYAHTRGTIHRDIKPSNVRITEAGQIKVTDFGIAGAIIEAVATVSVGEQRTVTIERFRGGTPGFMPPEVIHGEGADRRSDLFALGCVLYECLTGKQPFLAKTVEKTEANVRHLDPPRPSSLDAAVWPNLDAVTLKLLEKKPQDRYQSAGEVVAALEAVDEPRRKRATLPRQALLGYAAAALAVIIGFLTWSLLGGHTVPQQAMDSYRKGLESLEDGRYFNAASQLQNAVEIDPHFTMAHAHLAEAWDELDFANKAKDELLRAEPGRGMKTTDALHLKAIQATVTGDLGTAATSYQQLAKQVTGQDRAEALLDLGRVYDRAEKRPEAADAFAQAAKADPDSGAPFLRAASVYVTMRDTAKASKALDTAEERYKRSGKAEGVTECLYQRARLETNTTEALKLLDNALDHAKLYNNEQQQVKILLLKADRYLRAGESEKALAAANQALDQAQVGGLETLTTGGLIDVGRTLGIQGDTANAQRLLTKALSIARASGSKRNEARANANLALVYYILGSGDKTVECAQSALLFYQQGNYRSETARMLMQIADVKQDRGDYDSAMREYEQAIQAIPKDAPSVDLAQAEERLGGLFVVKEDFAQARRYLGQGFETARASNYRVGMAAVAADLAALSSRLGHDVEARSWLDKGEAVAAGKHQEYLRRARAWVDLDAGNYASASREFMGALTPGRVDEDMKPVLTTGAGLALARAGYLGEGNVLLERAAKMADAQHDPDLSASIELATAETAIAMGRRSDARPIVLKALPYFEQKGKRESAWRSWALLARVGTGAEARDAALKARNIYNQLTATWDSFDVKAYSSRPDIRKLLRAVNSLSKG